MGLDETFKLSSISTFLSVRPKGDLKKKPCSSISPFSPSWLGQISALLSSIVSCKGWILLHLHAFSSLFMPYKSAMTSDCLAPLRDCRGAGRHKAEVCWSEAWQQVGKPREKLGMGSHSQISRQGRSLSYSRTGVRRVHATLGI